MEKRRSDSQLLVKNLSFLYIGEVLNQLLTFLLIIFISRILGDASLGKYSFAFSFVALFLLLADFGLPTLITKEVAKNKKLSQEHLTKTFTLKLILNVLTLFITFIVIYISKNDNETILLVLLAGIAMFFYNFGGVLRSIFQAYELMKYEVIAKVTERSLAAIVGIYLLLKGYGIFSLFFVLITSNFFYYLILHFFILKKISNIGLSIDILYWKKIIKDSFPFWLTLIFVSVYFRIDTIMLGFMKDFAVTGWYNAAYKIIEVLVRIPFLLIIAVFPALAKFHNVSFSKMRLLYEKSFYYMIVLALPITTGLIVFSKKIILSIYGNQFENSIIALQILGFALFFIFVNYLMGYLLNSIDKQKLFTLTTGISTTLNVILNLILIPKYSYIGAGIATVASEILNFGMLYYFTGKSNFSINILKLISKPLIANIIMITALSYIKNINIIILSIIGAAMYFSILFAIKGLGREEISILRNLFK